MLRIVPDTANYMYMYEKHSRPEDKWNETHTAIDTKVQRQR